MQGKQLVLAVLSLCLFSTAAAFGVKRITCPSQCRPPNWIWCNDTEDTTCKNGACICKSLLATEEQQNPDWVEPDEDGG